MDMNIERIQNEIIEEFDFFDDWMQKYEYIIDIGKKLALIDPKHKTDRHLIRGCQSKVWLHAEMNDDKVVFTADSDAFITKGIIALLIRVLSGQTAKDIVESDLFFIPKIGLREHLSPTRSNGLNLMIEKIKKYGHAFVTVQEHK
jgi:cysteine desulfuration protein SufE